MSVHEPTFYGIQTPTLYQGIFTPYDPSLLCHILGPYFLLIWGVGVVKIVFIVRQTKPEVCEPSKKESATGLAIPPLPSDRQLASQAERFGSIVPDSLKEADLKCAY